MAKLTNQEFIDKATKIFNDKYDYSKVNYINDRSKIIIGCKEHGFVTVRSSQFIREGCPACFPSAKETIDYFIEKSNKIHNDIYDYSQVVSIKSYRDEHDKIKDLKVKITCKTCNLTFEQTSRNHLKGAGCPECAHKKRGASISAVKIREEKTVTQADFINKSIKYYGDKFDFSNTTFVNHKTKVSFRCKYHPDTLITRKPTDHIASGKAGYLGCRHCSNERIRERQTIKLDDFIATCTKIHNGKYSYDHLVQFNNIDENITVTCPKHGDFTHKASLHKAGHGCAMCTVISGKSENEWLDSLNIHTLVKQYRVDRGTYSLYVDGYDPITNTIYEYDGDYWHGNPNIYNQAEINEVVGLTFGELYQNTLKRTATLESLGYTVINMWEQDWKQILKERKINDTETEKRT